MVRCALYDTQIARFFPETLITLFNAFGASEKHNVDVPQCLDYIIKSVFICFSSEDYRVYIDIVIDKRKEKKDRWEMRENEEPGCFTRRKDRSRVSGILSSKPTF